MTPEDKYSKPKPKMDEDIVTVMVNKIDGFKGEGLNQYKICDLVEDAEKLGNKLVEKKLKTNQIRKFLDAVNRFKIEYGKTNIQPNEQPEILLQILKEKRDELHVLRYQLAYAAARQKKEKDPGPVEPLKKVLEAAIKQVRNENQDDFARDFARLVQLIESIVAYHKAAGGKDQ
ncbi:type III-A CRISPR-associated protein Csm2 [Aerosakkonemataceae cyanobacterium BLCC-F154]|uniref:CRISPR system Cms protein Csm2 n=1 Tax=Floridaenema fluviatile BLCC-F154 TaxID=3153640 RepID=A0ABV4Y820_9CYAN